MENISILVTLLGWFFSIIAITFGTKTLNHIRASGDQLNGQRVRTGVGVGAVTITLCSILVLLSIVAFIL